MNKIIVIGCSGSGKSTFSISLQKKTNLPIFHLDNIWWKEDRTHIQREEFDEKLNAICKKDKWIIDGNYSRTLEVRFSSCDTVIFLDYDTELCLDGITKRVGKHRQDIPWVEEKLNPELVNFVKSFKEVERPKIYALMERYPEKTYIIFKDRIEATTWLEKKLPAHTKNK